MSNKIAGRFFLLVFSITVIIFLTVITPVNAAEKVKLKVHFIDVGDADCILVQQSSSTMLIDAGNNSDEAVIKKYLLSQGIKKLDVVIGTHIDEDHIGSMDAVIKDFEVGKMYMSDPGITSKYLEDVLKAAEKKGLKLTAPVPEQSFKLGDAVCTILAPVNRGYEKLNNYSIVLKLQYGKISFLFTGDAEGISEREMMRRGLDLSANVLKLGHHGSISSTTEEFLNRVHPQYAVIMVGRNNKYNHPHKRTMEKLKTKQITVYRTDENGTIVVDSDGEKISFGCKPGSYKYRSSK